MKRFVVVIIVMMSLTVALSWTIFARIGKFSRLILGLMEGGYEQFTQLHVRTTLQRFAALPAVQKLDPKACEQFRTEINDESHFFSVLALGNASGHAICTADSRVQSPLPSMVDRLYYQRVKNSDALVVGEYAISRTTGKPALHFAYPLRADDGTFRGFLVAAVDLHWYVAGVVDTYFTNSDVHVLAVDQAGKLLFTYPSSSSDIGTPIFDAREASRMLSGKNAFFIQRDLEGVWRIYVYESMSEGITDHMIMLVGFSLRSFVGMFVLIGLLTVGSLYYIYALFVATRVTKA